jgi:hypothetical protein
MYIEACNNYNIETKKLTKYDTQLQFYKVIAVPQRLRSQRHKLSSLARTLGSSVPILLKDMDGCVCVYSVFVLSCV